MTYPTLVECLRAYAKEDERPARAELLEDAAKTIERLNGAISEGNRRIAELEAVIQRYEDEAAE